MKFNIKTIACVSIMMALAVILKTFGIMLGTTMRISLFAIPLLLSGIIGGFSWGLLAALGADLIYGFFFNPFGYNPIYTISALFWGFSGGLLKFSINRLGKLSWLFLGTIILVTSLFETCNNAIWDIVLYGKEITMVMMGYKILIIAIKFPIIIGIIKFVNDRVLKIVFKENGKK